jgi:hypothetical protein
MSEVPWFTIQEILDAYKKRFIVLGHKKQLWSTDSHLINRLNKFAHPQFAKIEDLENAVMMSPAQSTRKANINRYKMIYRHLFYLKLIPERESPAEKLPKLRKPKSMPRPFTHNEVALIMREAKEPQKHWFMLSCFAGFRAAEIALCSGADLEEIEDGFMIRIPAGKGGTDLALPAHPQIVEMECDKVGAYGHPQRNVGIKQVEDGFIYFLDDDNVIHPGFWELIGPLDPTKFYTFDQQRTASSVLRGNVIRVGHIDTAMFLVHKQQIRAIKWVENKYEADGLFISAIARTNPGAHVYVPQIACYYNFLCT